MKKKFTHKANGSLTVEAALVLPIFIYAMLIFIYFIQIIGLQESLQNAITETGLFASKYAYVYEYIKDYDSPDSKENNVDYSEEDSNNNTNNRTTNNLEIMIARSIDSVFYKSKLQDFVDVERINGSCIKYGFMGIQTFLSSYMEEDENIDIIINYDIKLPILFFHINKIHMAQRVRMRGWSGHKVEAKNSDKEEAAEEPIAIDQTVYITETGSVYHLSKDCTYLKLSVQEVPFTELEALRNESGGKYSECSLCKSDKGSQNHTSAFITDTGEKYHWNLKCSGLKRTIITIHLSEVGDRRTCSRCGK